MDIPGVRRSTKSRRLSATPLYRCCYLAETLGTAVASSPVLRERELLFQTGSAFFCLLTTYIHYCMYLVLN